MPSLFPVPTHLFRRQVVTNVGLQAVETGYNIRMLWQPQGMTNGTGSPGGLWYRKLNTGVANYSTYDTANDNTTTMATGAVAGETTAVVQTLYPNITNDVAHGGIRLVGAFIEIEYVGTVENHSGTIEVGFHPHARDDNVDTTILHFATDAEIIQMPFYKRYKPLDGARCIWFPIDSADFQFLPSGTSIASQQPYRPVNGQWCININGVQPSQGFRVHMCNVYESIPDEAMSDLFYPKKDTSGVSLEAAKGVLNNLVQAGAATTPAKNSLNWASVYDTIKSVATNLSTAAGLYNVARAMF